MDRFFFRAKIVLNFLWGLLLIGGIIPQVGRTQDGQAGTQSVLNFGAGARALGLGRAYVATVNDPTAVFWNPAGLEFVPRLSLTFFHAPLYEGAKYDFLGFVYPTLQFGTIGIGYARMTVGEVPVVDELNVFQGTASFENSELYIAYGKKLPYHVTGGFTFKIDRQQFSFLNLVTGGIGLDMGFIYQVQWDMGPLRDLVLGFHYQNLIKPQLKLGSETETLPAQMRFGFMKNIPVGLTGKMTLALDYSKISAEPGRLHIGSEYAFKSLGTIRLGFDRNHLAMGGGIRYSFVNIDYSFGSLGSDGEFPATHRFSITFNLGKSREELILIAEEERKRREKELIERTLEEERQRFIAEHLAKGSEYLEKENYFEAQFEFQMVISEDPFNKTAQVLLDSVNTHIQSELEKRQKEAIARAVNKELARENKRFVELHFEKAQIYLQKNQFTDALIEFNMALERAPDDPIILQAIQTAKRRLNEQVRRLVTQGRKQFQSGNYSEALRILSEALVLAPEDPQLKDEINALANRIKVQQYVQRALQLFNLGDFRNALSLFEEALSLDPSNETIRQYVERTKRGLGVVKEELDPESERQFIIGTDMFLKGRYQEALEVWKKLQEKYPYNKKIQDAIKNAEERIRRTKEKK